MFKKLDPKVKESLDLIEAQFAQIERKHADWYHQAAETRETCGDCAPVAHWSELVAAAS
jgi:hypothetical protein